jgi:beta-glucanase (GH16 family)
MKCPIIAAMLMATAVMAFAQKREHRFSQQPVWQDEFSYSGLPDTSKWGYDVGGHGWGNRELQFYTAGKNAWVQEGILNIVAKPEKIQENTYSSARLVSRGKGDFLYGRFEASARLPKGVGTWPAIWMLPTHWAYGDWPASGEIDIMEHVGYDPEKIHISIHTKSFNHLAGTQRSAFRVLPGCLDSFHRYRVDWTPDYIRGFLDDQMIFEYLHEPGFGPDQWPFDKAFHWIINLAVGGNWGGQKGMDAAAFPATLQVDYVRIYALEN